MRKHIPFRLTLILLTFAFLLISSTFSQDPTWVTDITHEVGLDSAQGSRIMIVDINNDNYPDLLWGSGSLIKNRIKLFKNIENPDQNSPFKRIFEDVTESSGINVNRDPEKEGRYADVSAMADLDNDGDMDLVTSIYYHRLQMYSGVDSIRVHIDSMIVGDSTEYIDSVYARDRDPGDRSEVYLNDGNGHFTLVPNSGLNDIRVVDSLPVGLINATGFSFLDYDHDGNLDLYISTWFSDYKANLDGLGSYVMPDVLLKGNGDGTFTYIKNSGIENIQQPMYGVNATDWDNDGWQDIVTSGYCRSGGSLFKNMQDGTFLDVSYDSRYSGQLMQGDHGQNLCQWEAQPADFDNDGDMDFLQVNVHGGYDQNEGRTHVTINTGPENLYRLQWDINRIKRDAPNNSHLGDQGGQWVDINGDGWQDIAIGQMGYASANIYGQERLYICLQDEEGNFNDISKILNIHHSLSESHSMEPCDFDLDGDLDLFVSHNVRDTAIVDSVPVYSSHMQISLLRNNVADEVNWISVKAHPPANANQSGIGTRIKVHSAGMTQMQDIQAGLGHFSGEQSFVRNFGIGNKNRIDSIEVRWPNTENTTTTIYNPPLNLVLNVGENGLIDYFETWDEPAAVITFDKSHLDFDTVETGESKELLFEIMNIGDADLIVEDVNLEGPDTEGFIPEISDTSFTLEAGQSREILVRFAPATRKVNKAMLTFISNAVNAPTRSFDLEGFGFEEKPLISLSTNSIEFDTKWIDSVDTKMITVSNIGELPLQLEGFNFSGDGARAFAYSGDELPMEIEAGGSREIPVTFKPDEIIEFTASMDIVSNAYNTVEEVALHGLCDGPKPEISISPLAYLFNVRLGSFKEKEMTISNSGNASLEVLNIVVEGDTAGVYTFHNIEEIPFNVAINDEKAFIIRFTPEDTIDYIYELVLTSNDPVNPELRIRMNGKGKKPVSVYENIDKSIRLSLSPNPVSDNAVLRCEFEDAAISSLPVEMYDIYGRKVMEINNSGIDGTVYETVIDTSFLSAGNYYLLVSINGIKASIPVIIVR